MKIFCDDGSTNVKLAWFEGKKLKSALSTNSFRNGWKVEGIGSRQTYNYTLDGSRFTYDEVSSDVVSTTHIEYQYSDINVLAVHHALLNSGLDPQDVSLTVTLPICEYYTQDCQKNILNIQRKIDNLLRPVLLNKGETFNISHIDVMPESLPAVFTQLVQDNVGPFEKSLVIDLGGTTLDVGIIVGQFDDVSAIHGNANIGVSAVTRSVLSALKSAHSDTSPMIADELIKRRNDQEFVNQVINDASRTQLVLGTIESQIERLGARVVDDLSGEFRHVNRVYVVGGGAPLIIDAVKVAWSHLGDKVLMVPNPQIALASSIAQFHGA